MNHPRHGFSLIELLVVISIIALLVGILLPVLIVARFRARDMACRSQIRQLGTGLTIYTNDYKDWYPFRSEAAVISPLNWSKTGTGAFDLHDEIERLITASEVYGCPLNEDIDWEDNWPRPDGSHRWTSYGTFANYTSTNVTIRQPDGTAAPYQEVVSQRIDTAFPGRPIMGEVMTFNPSKGFWISRHARNIPMTIDEGGESSYFMPDGSIFTATEGFVILADHNTGFDEAWIVKE